MDWGFKQMTFLNFKQLWKDDNTKQVHSFKNSRTDIKNTTKN